VKPLTYIDGVAGKRRGSVVTELYESIADWWLVISPPSEYAEEAALSTSRWFGARLAARSTWCSS
jgi:hypothetical protein